jgi:Ankyrin repeats (3 copies)
MVEKSRLALAIAGMLLLGFLASFLEPQFVFAQSANDQLIDALRSGNVSAVQQALAAGADVNAKHNGGWMAVMLATPWGETNRIKLLLDHGADVNAKSDGGWTALMVAASGIGHANIARLLLDHGADVNARNSDGKTAKDLATTPEIAALLRSYASQRIAELTQLAPGQSAREKLSSLASQLQEGPNSQMVAEAILKISDQVKPPPAIPDKAHEHMVTGATFLKGAKSPEDFQQAVAEFQKAVLAAPWWGDAYYNLGVAEEAAGDYLAAKRDLQMHLDSNPGPSDAQAAKDKIYEIDAKAKLAAENPAPTSSGSTEPPVVSEAQIEQNVAAHEQQVISNLSGSWFCQAGCNRAEVSVTGNAFTAHIWAPVAFPGCEDDENGQCSQTGVVDFAGTIQGLGVNGTATVRGGHINPTNCNFGSSSAPFAATISTDGNSIVLNYAQHTWEFHAQRTIFGVQCSSADPDGTTPATAVLTR